jgi:hypothetical protein
MALGIGMGGAGNLCAESRLTQKGRTGTYIKAFSKIFVPFFNRCEQNGFLCAHFQNTSKL